MKYEDDNIILLVIEYLKYFHKLCDVNNIQINGMSLSPGTLDYDVVYTIKPPHPRFPDEIVGKVNNKELNRFKALKRKDKINDILNVK